MKRFILSLMCLLFLTPPLLAASGDDLRVMTFNIRLFNLTDGENGWFVRRDLLYKTIEAFDPDLLGTQEVVLLQRENLKEHFKAAYDTVGVGRNDGKDSGEHALIFFKRDRFEKVREGNFWLSQTPDKPGSKGWDAKLPRICSWVELRDKKSSNRSIVYFNTHWDHVGKVARQESAKLMRQRIETIAGDKPVVITGDFNSPQDSPQYKVLLKDRFFDAFAEAHPSPTTQDFTAHNFTGKNPRPERIDWILHSADFQAVSATIDRTNVNGQYPSDHFPVEAVLRWKD